MTQTTMLLLVAAIVAVALIMWAVWKRQRSLFLRRHFGREYDRLARETGDLNRAESALVRRAKRVRQFVIRPLPPDRRQMYERQWRDQQVRFVDEPNAAVGSADHLVEEVMKERGYPVSDFEQQAADISVDHPRVVENYRAAHDICVREHRGMASTDDLRNAMLYYRDLFLELLEDGPTPTPARIR